MAVSPARANTYLFSFTAGQLLDALHTAQGDDLFKESAYFAVFVQPDPIQVSTYSYVSVSSPNPTDPNVWETNTITDPASSNLGYVSNCTANCTWAMFRKDPDAFNVTVVSGANGGTGGANIFQNGFYPGDTPAPYGWGESLGIIDTIMPLNSLFQFVINTPNTLSGTIHLKGSASSVKSGDPSTMTIDSKEREGIAFSLDVNFGGAVPEPSTWTMMALGCVAAAIARRVRRRQ